MNFKKAVLFLSFVAFSGVAVAQDATPSPSPSPTPVLRGCKDRDINRKITRVDLKQRLVDNLEDRKSLQEQNRDVRVEQINEDIKDIRDGRSPVSAGFCKIISFIKKCDTSKAIARLENRREKYQAQFKIRIARIEKLIARAVERRNLETKALEDLYKRCNITPPNGTV